MRTKVHKSLLTSKREWGTWKTTDSKTPDQRWNASCHKCRATRGDSLSKADFICYLKEIGWKYAKGKWECQYCAKDKVTMECRGREATHIATHIAPQAASDQGSPLTKALTPKAALKPPSPIPQALNVIGPPTSLSPFQQEVGEWATKTFPNSPPEAWLEHLQWEASELAKCKKPNEIAEEAADCLILLLGFAHIKGFDLMAAAQEKLAVNRRRRWGKPNKKGVVQHLTGKVVNPDI